MKIKYKHLIFLNFYVITFLFIFNVTLLTLIIINLCQNNLTTIDNPGFSSALYITWTFDSNPADTVTIKKNKMNRKYNLTVKNSVEVNIILPLASECNEGDYLIINFKEIDENLGKTYYLYEDLSTSIFQQNTYFINILYNKVKLQIINNAWSQVGCGVIESP